MSRRARRRAPPTTRAELAQHLRLAQLRPLDREAQNNLGIILRKVGRVEDAVAAHRRALALAPDYAKARGGVSVSVAPSVVARRARIDRSIPLLLAPLDPPLLLPFPSLPFPSPP